LIGPKEAFRALKKHRVEQIRRFKCNHETDLLCTRPLAVTARGEAHNVVIGCLRWEGRAKARTWFTPSLGQRGRMPLSISLRNRICAEGQNRTGDTWFF
jgi:hypothetical protein